MNITTDQALILLLADLQAQIIGLRQDNEAQREHITQLEIHLAAAQAETPDAPVT